MMYPFNLSFSLSVLFMGFLLSNIFGILGSSKSIVFLFIVCIELTNYFVYTKNRKLSPLKGFLLRVTQTKVINSMQISSKSDAYVVQQKFKNIPTIGTVINFFKIGFEFGFFIDAFKLGS